MNYENGHFKAEHAGGNWGGLEAVMSLCEHRQYSTVQYSTFHFSFTQIFLHLTVAFGG